MIIAAAARASRLRATRRRGVTARRAPNDRAIFLLLLRCGSLGLRRCGGFRCLTSLFLGLLASFLSRCLFGLAIVFGAAALFLALLGAGPILAAARFLEAGEPRFLGLAEELGLHLLAGGNLFALCQLARLRSRWLRRDRSRRWRRGHCFRLRRLGRGRFAGAADDAPLLDLDDHRVRAAVAEALLDLAGLDRALEAQRRPGSKLRFFGLVCHSIPSSNLRQPSRSSRWVLHLPDHKSGQ